MRNQFAIWVLLCAVATAGRAAEFDSDEGKTSTPGIIHVDVTPGHALNSLVPIRTLGAGVDAVPGGAIAKIYTPGNLALMLSAGHGALSYRLFTELSVQAWHWNSAGTWSDPTGKGYFTGSSTQKDPNPITSFGYDLPHRGNTLDQGAQDGFSKLTDGDNTTYWKSNPYLTKLFTGEDDALHPQWVIVDLGAIKSINAIHIEWGDPFAVNFVAQYWEGDSPIDSPADGAWKPFPNGDVKDSKGGSMMLKISDVPLRIRFARILMSTSSGTFDSHGNGDPRNGVGYAIFEIGVGNVSTDGSFVDEVRHGMGQKQQTTTYASSVDPWHEAAAKNTNQEQAGIDQVFASGLTRNLPTMLPVAVLYGIPDDAAAEITYLKTQSYPISFIEMGEEPDGQYITPEDYGALFLQFSSAIHAVDPTIKLGGPAFQGGDRIQTWPDAAGETSWFKRFLNFLKTHGRLADLEFFSFEHYPFNSGDGVGKKAFAALLKEPAKIAGELGNFRSDGLPANVPVFVTEYNFSADNTPATMDIAGALWHADFIGSFLSLGGSGANYYEYEPTQSDRSKGTLGMFFADANYSIVSRTSQFYSTQMIMQHWLSPQDAAHEIYPTVSTVMDKNSNVLVTAYAVKRPDGQWAIMLINKDPNKKIDVNVDFENVLDGSAPGFAGPITQVTFGAAQFRWHSQSTRSFAKPNSSPQIVTLTALPGALTLPKASITILSGALK